MINKLEYYIKHNVLVQYTYKNVFGFLLRLIGLFIKINKKTILFSSFGGKKFNDSPMYLYNAIKRDKRFLDYNLIWAFTEPKNYKSYDINTVQINSLKYFITALKSKVWITSVNIERGLRFKKRQTIYINTWHGAGTKKIGNACQNRKDYNFSNVDLLLVQSFFEKEIFIRDFKVREEAIRKIGFPRSDFLFNLENEKAEAEEIKNFLKIDKKCKIILYAPTWRDSTNKGKTYELKIPLSFERLKETLPENYVILFRSHAFTTEINEIIFDNRLIDVSNIPNVNELLRITNLVITDYSTIIYDAVAARIPFICFGYDYDEYKNTRGFYYDLELYYPYGVIRDEYKLQELLLSADVFDFSKFKAFRDRFIDAGGNSVNLILDELANRIN